MARKKQINADRVVEQIIQLDISEQVALLNKLKEIVRTSLTQKEKELSDLVEKFRQ
jgi:hypothetical protein